MTDDRLPLAELLAKAGDSDFLRSVAEAVLQMLMEADVEGLIGAGRHERTGERLNYRNGFRDRTLDTRLGSLQLRIPKLRQGSYFPPFLEPRKTSEKALVAVIQEAWIGGVSTRRVDELVQAMGLSSISKSTVSKLCKDIDERVGAFLDRPLSGEWPYLWLDATYLRQREGGRIVSVAAIIAVACDAGFRNKTDKNDARGIADLMRVNKFRAVMVKSVGAQRDRALLTVREQLRRQSLDARNIIWSILQVEGLKPPKLTSPAFQALVVQSLENEALAPLLQPLVAVVEHLDDQVAGLDKVIAARAKASAACKRLMTVPGVGPLVALTYAAGVDDPARFSDSRTVGAHFGLTPRRFQSGEMDWSGGISRAGDAGVRRALYQAANVLIHHSRGWCALKSWAVRIAKRRGLGKAKVALARKLAVVLHKMWTTGTDYRLQAAP